MGPGLAYFFPKISIADFILQGSLIALLFFTFLQIPVKNIPKSIKDHRFMGSLLIGNFIVVPFIVIGLIILWSLIFGIGKNCPSQRDIFFGHLQCELSILFPVVVVLVAPCVDYVISFCRAAKGDFISLTAATPILFVFQCILFLLPLFLLAINGKKLELTLLLSVGQSFFLIIILPIFAAWFLQSMASKFTFVLKLDEELKKWVVPVTAFVLLVVMFFVGSSIFKGLQSEYNSINSFSIFSVWSIYYQLLMALPLFIAFHFIAPFAGILVSQLFKLRSDQAIAVCFSMSTRNSLVILPLVIAISFFENNFFILIILLQICVELIAEVTYIRLIPWLTNRIRIK